MKSIISAMLLIIVCAIVIDSIQAPLLKNSTVIHIRNSNLADEDSYVDRGILVDTFYCVKEKDIVTVKWYFKLNKFTCPIE